MGGANYIVTVGVAFRQQRSIPNSTWVEKMSGGERQLAVGLISGTSMDGIDACVLEIIEEQHTDNQSASENELKYKNMQPAKLLSPACDCCPLSDVSFSTQQHFNSLYYISISTA